MITKLNPSLKCLLLVATLLGLLSACAPGSDAVKPVVTASDEEQSPPPTGGDPAGKDNAPVFPKPAVPAPQNPDSPTAPNEPAAPTPPQGVVWNCFNSVNGKGLRIVGRAWDFGVNLSMEVSGEASAPLALDKTAFLGSPKYRKDESFFCSKTKVNGEDALNHIEIRENVGAAPGTYQAVFTRYRGTAAAQECRNAGSLKDYDQKFMMSCEFDGSGTIADESYLPKAPGIMDLGFGEKGTLNAHADADKFFKFAYPEAILPHGDGTLIRFHKHSFEPHQFVFSRLDSSGARDKSFGQKDGYLTLALPSDLLGAQRLDEVLSMTEGPKGSFFILGKLSKSGIFIAHVQKNGDLDFSFLINGYMLVEKSTERQYRFGHLEYAQGSLFLSTSYYMAGVTRYFEISKIKPMEGVDTTYGKIAPELGTVTTALTLENGSTALLFVVDSKYYLGSIAFDGTVTKQPMTLSLKKADYGNYSFLKDRADGFFVVYESIDTHDSPPDFYHFDGSFVRDPKFKFDLNGVRWTRAYTGYNGLQVSVLPHGGLAFPGKWQAPVSKDFQPMVLVTDATGKMISQRANSALGLFSLGHLNGSLKDAKIFTWTDVNGKFNLMSTFGFGYSQGLMVMRLQY